MVLDPRLTATSWSTSSTIDTGPTVLPVSSDTGKKIDTARLAEMAKKRAEIQKQIEKLKVDRDKYVAAERAKAEPAAAESFDAAVIRAVEVQAAKK